MIEIKK